MKLQICLHSLAPTYSYSTDTPIYRLVPGGEQALGMFDFLLVDLGPAIASAPRPGCFSSGGGTFRPQFPFQNPQPEEC